MTPLLAFTFHALTGFGLGFAVGVLLALAGAGRDPDRRRWRGG